MFPMDMERIVGLIGLGRMGLPVARHFLRAGFRVLGYRRSAVEDFVAMGGEARCSPAEVFAEAPVIFTCLPDDAALDAVVRGRDGFLSAGVRDRIVAELSTTRLAARLQLSELLRQAGSMMLDCPISGTPPIVEQRRAVFLASGERAAFDEVAWLLRMLSDEVFYLGPFGAGTKAKYIANYLMTVHAAAAAEAVAMAQRSGLDVDKVVAVLGQGAGGSFQLTSRGPRMVSGAYRPAPATLTELTKDLGLIDEFAASLGLASGLLSTTTALVNEAKDLGFSDCDPAALIEAVRASLSSDRRCNAP